MAEVPPRPRPAPYRLAAFAVALTAVLGCGVAWAALPPGGAGRLTAVEVVGTAFRVATADGRVLQGRALRGATLWLELTPGAAPQPVRLDQIVPDPADRFGDLLLYRMRRLDPATGRAEELCDPDATGARWAFPLAGRWDAEGRRISEHGLTLACAAEGAIGKCVRWGYRPWARSGDVSLAPYHQACVRMVRADYCGGHGTTRDGMSIDLFDRLGINRPEPGGGPAHLSFEAAWGPEGALCVAHPRVPAKISWPVLTANCPRLTGRLGPEKCLEGAAREGQYGTALVFNRSR